VPLRGAVAAAVEVYCHALSRRRRRPAPPPPSPSPPPRLAHPLTPTPPAQIVAAIFICLFFALVFNATKACLKENDNFFNFYAEIDLLFVLIVSLLLYTDVADEEGYGTGLVGGLLIFAAVFVVVMGLGLLLLEAEEEFMFSHTLAAKWRGGMRKEKAATGAEEEVELELGGMIFETENPMGAAAVLVVAARGTTHVVVDEHGAAAPPVRLRSQGAGAHGEEARVEGVSLS